MSMVATVVLGDIDASATRPRALIAAQRGLTESFTGKLMIWRELGLAYNLFLPFIRSCAKIRLCTPCDLAWFRLI